MKISLNVFIFLCLLNIPFVVYAQKEKLPISLTARINSSSGIEQVSLVFKEDKAIIVLNSNFLNPGKVPTRLGVFEKKIDPDLNNLKIVLTADTGNIELYQTSAKKAGPHRVQLLLGNKEVSEDSSSFQRLKETLESLVSELNQWQVSNGVQISEDNGKLYYQLIQNKNERPKEITCNKKMFCYIPDYGYYWKSKKNLK